MSEKLLDIPLGDEKVGAENDWESVGNVPFSGDKLDPITVKSKGANTQEKKAQRKEYWQKSDAEKAREDKIVGTAAATVAGAAVGLGFVGAGLSAPIAGAAIAGVAAYNKLKKNETNVRRKEYRDEYGGEISDWKKMLDEDMRKNSGK